MPDARVKIIDASAVVAVVFDEPERARIADRVRGFDLVAPTLLEFELANVCLMKLRRKPDQRDTLLAAYRLRRRLPVETLDGDFAAVLALADRTGLTGYDASYLWLARSLGAELVTLDGKLAEADRRTP